MALESATYPNQLVATNPTGTDQKAQGDDHIRLLKAVLQATFPNISGAVLPTHTELNHVDGVTSPIQSQLDALAAADVAALTGAQTITGDKAFTGTNTHSGAETHTGLESFAKTKFSTPHGASYQNNIAFSATCAANALTIALLGNDAIDPSATNPVESAFRSATLTTGTSTVRTATAAIAITVPDGATLGRLVSEADYVYVYELDYVGTVEITVAGTPQNTTALVNTTAIGTGSDSKDVLYSVTARTGVAIRYVGKVLITHGGVLGQWSAQPTSLHNATEPPPMFALGYGQTWQDVTGSRSLATTYTNSTGRPIQVSVALSGGGATNTFNASLFVGAVTASLLIAKDGQDYNGSTGNTGFAFVSGVIPPGYTYQVTVTTMTVVSWAELR